MDDNKNTKIIDFGLSNLFDEEHYLTTFCGSPKYAAPEIITGTKYIGTEKHFFFGFHQNISLIQFVYLFNRTWC